MVVIRPATVNDAGDLATLYLQSAEHHAALDPDFYRVPERPPVVAHYTEMLASNVDSDGFVLVAESEGAVIGMVEVQIGGLPSAHSMIAPQRPATLAMVVDQRHRSTGVGSKLISQAEQSANQIGADVVILDVLAANGDAILLYNRLGYREHGRLLLKRNRHP